MDFDDDGYNAIDDVDLDALQYPEGDVALSNEDQENALGRGAELALNDFASRKRRRSADRQQREEDNMPEGMHPLDWHMRCPITSENSEAKRFKQLQEETIIERTKQRIREAELRKAGQLVGQTVGQKRVNAHYEELDMQNEVLAQPPLDGSNWIGFTDCDDSKRLYLRWRKDRATLALRELDDSLKDYKRDVLLFGYDKIHQTFQEAKKIRENLRAFQTECEEKARQREIVAIYEQNEQDLPEGISEAVLEERSTEKGGELWARKYAPTVYAHLLSDDAVNRNAITWLRLWEECVFKRKHTVQAIETRLNERERAMFSMESRAGNNLRRPHFKVLLLAGPAGSGKTTLAGVIARLCGYATVELNASDSRNAPDFEKAIDGALRNAYTIDNGNKPNCLILDEIDGAPAEAIRYLTRTLQVQGKKAIKRPIIAICNSLFTTSLRELRPMCLVLNVNAIRKERLVERLQRIAQLENINIDTLSLEKLIAASENDVRSSLNTLQLLANSNQGKRITVAQVLQAVESAHPSVDKSLFESLSTVLELARHLDNKGHLLSVRERLGRVERVANEQGDERFVAGLHANYASSNLPIGTLSRAASSFVYWDTVNLKVSTTQNYSLMKYMLVFYTRLHVTVATHAKLYLQISQADYQMSQKLKVFNETLAMLRGSHYAGLAVLPLLLDTCPYLLQIVQPALRASNEQLYTAHEKAQIEHTISVMIDYNLTFVPTTVDNNTHFNFQPPIDALCMFPLSTTAEANHIELPHATRQLIAKKIELWRLSSGLHALEHERPDSTMSTGSGSGKGEGSSRMRQIEEAQGQKGKGRLINRTEHGQRHDGVIHYKYNQGFSNAVKKSVRMMDLLN